MTKMDRKLLLIFLIIALLAWAIPQLPLFFTAQTNQAVIKVQGQVSAVVALQKNKPAQTIKVKGKIGEALVEIKAGKIRMLTAPCPDKICVQQGWIRQFPQTIICLPNEIVIQIIATTSLDGITG